jgi:hypothetical protein
VDEEYHLIGTIDSSGGHFTNRFIYQNQECYYDGMHSAGSLRLGLSTTMQTMADNHMLQWKDFRGKSHYDLSV